jgi:hypothetical protein
MTTYSLRFIDADRRMLSSKQIECSTDEQAIELAGQEVDDQWGIQVWDGDRPVCLVGNNPRETA